MKKLMFSLFAIFAVALSACGGQVVVNSTVRFVINETSLKSLDGLSVPHGSVTFTVINADTKAQELVVLKTDTKPESLRVDANGKVIEGENVGGIYNLEPGKFNSVTLELKSGRYVLICKAPDSRAPFVVT